MTKRILVVDDDNSIVECLRYLLEEAGFLVDTCADGSFVGKKLNGTRPDLILLDYWLPGENGGDITKKLKRKSETKHIPVIVISANYNVKERVYKAGADDFLPKPFDIYDMLNTVKKHLTK